MEINLNGTDMIPDIGQLIDDLRKDNPALEKCSIAKVAHKPAHRLLTLAGRGINLTHLVTSFTTGIRIVDLATHHSGANTVVTITIELSQS